MTTAITPIARAIPFMAFLSRSSRHPAGGLSAVARAGRIRLTPSGSGQPVSPQIRGQPGRSREEGQKDDRHAVAAANAAKSMAPASANTDVMTTADRPGPAEPDALPADALPVDELPPG